MDICTRLVADRIFQSSIRIIDLIKIINHIELAHRLKGVTVRNDNRSQFIAFKVWHYLRNPEANQEFTHIETPEENSYSEAFHSILEREVIKRFDFESFYEAKLTLATFMDHYNIKRKHGSLKRKAPMQVWNEFHISFSSDKQPSAQLSVEKSRVSGCADTGLAPDRSGDTAKFADRLRNENENKKVPNSFNNIVRVIGG